MDFDNDGILDIISGSYDPGDLYLIRGLGKGEYAKIQKILDKNGLALVHHPIELARYETVSKDKDADQKDSINDRVASFGSWPATVDWDGDGDLDMLIGSFGGELFLRMNEGTRAKPEFSGESISVKANDEPIKVNGHACPAVADWNNDGKWDIVLGSDVGSVGWHENAGSAKEPRFGMFQELIPAVAEQKFIVQELEQGETPKPGVRTQICVADYDHDGRMDLLVGDFSEIKIKRELTDEEQAEQAALVADSKEIAEKLNELGYDEAKQEDRQKLVEQLMELMEKEKGFYASSGNSSFVWLYLRENEATAIRKSTNVRTIQLDEPATDSDNESDSDSPVEISTSVASVESKDSSDARYKVSIKFEIEPGWHLYDSAGNGNLSQAVEVELKPSEGIELVGDWDRPSGDPDTKNLGTRLYHDQVTLTHEVKCKSKQTTGTIEATIRYQVCNQKLCLPPVAKTQTISVKE